MEIDQFTKYAIYIDEAKNAHDADFDVGNPRPIQIVPASVLIDKVNETAKNIQRARKATALGAVFFILCVILIIIFVILDIWKFWDGLITLFCFLGISFLTILCGILWRVCSIGYLRMMGAWSYNGSSLYFNNALKYVEYIKYCVDYGDNNKAVNIDNISNIPQQGPTINILESQVICSFNEIEKISPILTDKINRYKVEIFIKNKNNWKTPKDYHTSHFQKEFKTYFSNVLSQIDLSSKLWWHTLLPTNNDYDPYYGD